MILLNLFQGMDFYNGLFFLLQAFGVVDFWSFLGRAFAVAVTLEKWCWHLNELPIHLNGTETPRLESR